MAVLGSLAVNIVSKFDSRGVKKGKKEMRGFTNFASMASTAAVGAGLGFVAFAKSTAASVDALGKQANILGLSTEAMFSYQEAAQLSGVTVQQLNKGFQRSQSAVAQAAAGNKELNRQLKLVGLSAEKLNDMNPAKQFETLLGAVEMINSQSGQMDFIERFFGARASGFLNLATMNLQELRREMDGLAPSQEDAKRMAEFNDTMQLLSTQFKSVGRDFVLTVGPDAVEFAKDLLEGAKALREITSEFSSKRKLLTGESGVGLGTFFAPGLSAARAFTNFQQSRLEASGNSPAIRTGGLN